ncbi:DMT family transporter [Dictyobacter arantiisoli]|uniref:EamA domain-containing protein n=1 Tax=Dictyobacter arantiisoli TaxID=2014874 RepID=A0A5A5TDW5_9CHLR|nr:DMT family transporter [Dictyobacter arantiisoli]GCF09741.1 hypothetical protein KDI_33050 [Dictyobacter arantiisoli]
MLSTRRWLSDAILLIIACIWGITFVLVQDAIVLLPPLTFLALRFGFAALLLLLFARLTQKRGAVPISSRRALFGSGIVLGCILFLGYGLQTFSLLYTTSGKSGFLTGLSVALVPLCAWLILRTRPGLTSLGGVGMATIGLYLLAFVDLNHINPGDILAFFCSIAFALQVIYTEKFVARTAINYLVVIQLGTVACLSGIAALFFEPWQHIFQSTVLWQPDVLLALIIVPTGGCPSLDGTDGQRRLSGFSVHLFFRSYILWSCRKGARSWLQWKKNAHLVNWLLSGVSMSKRSSMPLWEPRSMVA